MKKVAVGLLVAFLCSFSFAGTITYACGHTASVEGGTRNMKSNEKCSACIKEGICQQLENSTNLSVSEYKSICE